MCQGTYDEWWACLFSNLIYFVPSTKSVKRWTLTENGKSPESKDWVKDVLYMVLLCSICARDLLSLWTGDIKNSCICVSKMNKHLVGLEEIFFFFVIIFISGWIFSVIKWKDRPWVCVCLLYNMQNVVCWMGIVSEYTVLMKQNLQLSN